MLNIFMFFSLHEILEILRRIKELNVSIDDELRGWNWKNPPLISPFSKLINVSDLAGIECKTHRFGYVKYVLKIKGEENKLLQVGALTHRLYSLAYQNCKLIVYLYFPKNGQEFYDKFIEKKQEIYKEAERYYALGSDSKKIVDIIWNYAAHSFASSYDKIMIQSKHLNPDSVVGIISPVITEFPLDGSLLGFNRSVRIDGYVYPNLLIEIKTGELRSTAELGLACYSLIFESIYHIPIDAGLLLNVVFENDFSSFKVYEKNIIISESLRTRLIEERDEFIKIVENEIDPGLPEFCDPKCPYLKFCKNEK
jgi:CRISPR-associated protein, Csa1 family